MMQMRQDPIDCKGQDVKELFRSDELFERTDSQL